MVGESERGGAERGVPSRARAASPPSEVVAGRLAELRERIEAADRDPAGVRVVAVTKGFDDAAVATAYRVGLRDIAENHADELVAKASVPFDFSAELTWHLIGAIQRRKVKALAEHVGCWQTVSRTEEVETLARYAPQAQVFVQVDTTGLAGRNGCTPQQVPGLVSVASSSGLQVRGLMTVGPPGPPLQVRNGFELVARIGRDVGVEELSMGMSEDLDIALRAGSTMVRVGRALFGSRPERYG